jgi:MFS family permease
MRTPRARTLVAVIAGISVYGLTFGLTTPLLSLILESRGAERGIIGLVAAMPGLSLVIVSPFVPALLASVGVLRLLGICLLLDLLLVLALPLFDGLAAWILIRFLTGATTACLFIAAETWINELAEEATRGRVIAVYNAALAASTAAGPVIIPLTGIEGWLPFLIAGACIVVAGVPLAFATGGMKVVSPKHSTFRMTTFVRTVPAIAMSIFVLAFVDFAILALLPVYGVRNGLREASAAIMLTIVGIGRIILQYPIGWMADRSDRASLMLVCVGGTAAGALLLPWAIGRPGMLAMLLLAWGGFLGGIYTIALTIVGQRFRATELAVANAAIGVLWGVGGLVGPAAVGLAMDVVDPGGFVITIVLACTLVLMTRRPATGAGNPH